MDNRCVLGPAAQGDNGGGLFVVKRRTVRDNGETHSLGQTAKPEPRVLDQRQFSPGET